VDADPETLRLNFRLSAFRYNRAVNFRKATATYEKWLSSQLRIIPQDLVRKHELMREALFPFFRATFYHWAQLWPEVCPECADTPEVLAVGDLHVENFGTWRDAEGRLVWGINDFDEVARMPYAIDLVRLAASAHIAIQTEQLRIAGKEACGALLTGYRECLEAGGHPWVLGGKHEWLYEMVKPSLRNPTLFWEKLEALPEYSGRIPGNARRALERMMPASPKGKRSKWRIVHRIAGLGSLGRQRFVALADRGGGPLCREAKALAPSGWDWARGDGDTRIRYQDALETAVRAIDPFVHLQARWIARRLAPDCSKIDLAAFPAEKDETKLLHAMGWETANLHIGSKRTGRILADLGKRPRNWLHKAAVNMVAATTQDWNEWRASRKTSLE
jgi:hypothetical protein